MIATEAPRVVRASYVLRQQFRYDYPGPIADLRHRLVVAPPSRYGDQVRVHHRLDTGDRVNLRWTRDRFGNAVALLAADRFEGTLVLDYEARVERGGSCDRPAPDWYDDGAFRASSVLTKPSLALREAAESLMASDDGSGHLATSINAFVARHMRYVSDVTSVETTAAEAFAQGTGVCQDYAHVMIALCRLCAIPARYVSGHLLGEGGTHAWVEAIEPGPTGDAEVAAFDPTHDRRANLNYVFIAAGRDYADVAPTSGSFTAPYVGTFTTSRRVDVLDVEYAA
jgi:transglutaminase-like putative cysteine protease